MVKINFKEFEMPTDITKKVMMKGDARESFANLLYTRSTGIKPHALAMKIYQSEGDTDYSDDEVQLIRQLAAQFCVPAFIDGLEIQLNNNHKTD